MNAGVGLMAIAALAVLSVGSAQAQGRTPTEYEVKAAFIYNFARYVQWPGQSVRSGNFVIGIMGKDPFGRVIDDAVRGRTVQGRAVVVRRLGRTEEAANCDLLFVSSSESARLNDILHGLHRAPVLTVADMDSFAEKGGMINLTTSEDRIRFEVNVQAIDRAGLKAGSQLLRLARLVNETRSDR